MKTITKIQDFDGALKEIRRIKMRYSKINKYQKILYKTHISFDYSKINL
jgi:hypothetical protein